MTMLLKLWVGLLNRIINHQFITVQMNHYKIDITGINERADKLTLESGVQKY